MFLISPRGWVVRPCESPSPLLCLPDHSVAVLCACPFEKMVGVVPSFSAVMTASHNFLCEFFASILPACAESTPCLYGQYQSGINQNGQGSVSWVLIARCQSTHHFRDEWTFVSLYIFGCVCVGWCVCILLGDPCSQFCDKSMLYVYLSAAFCFRHQSDLTGVRTLQSGRLKKRRLDTLVGLGHKLIIDANVSLCISILGVVWAYRIPIISCFLYDKVIGPIPTSLVCYSPR